MTNHGDDDEGAGVELHALKLRVQWNELVWKDGGACDYGDRTLALLIQGSYTNKKVKFQYIPEWIQLNFQNISDLVTHA